MSSNASFVSQLATAQAGSGVANNYNMNVVGGRFETTPVQVPDGAIRAFQIDDYGRQVVIGPTADANTFLNRPLGVGGVYRSTLPTYVNGQATVVHMDDRGRTHVTDTQAQTLLAAILAAVDTLETLIGNSNTSLNAIDDNTDALEGYLDTVESLIGTGNASLASIDAGIPAALGQTTMAASMPVVLPSNQIIPTQSAGKDYVGSARNDYASVNVTSGAWVQLIASTAAAASLMFLSDTSGYALELGFGGAGLESRVLLIPPGGLSSPVPMSVPAGTRISVRAISTTADAGELNLTLLG